MNKVTVELSIPDGYEIAEGEQPRIPVSGDIFLDDMKPEKANWDFEQSYYIILKKKAPKYRVINDLAHIVNADLEEIRYVEIKALKDALGLLRSETDASLFVYSKKETYEALKELVE